MYCTRSLAPDVVLIRLASQRPAEIQLQRTGTCRPRPGGKGGELAENSPDNSEKRGKYMIFRELRKVSEGDA
jgi:hypothetical protein